VVAGRWQLVATSGGCLPWPSRLSLMQQTHYELHQTHYLNLQESHRYNLSLSPFDKFWYLYLFITFSNQSNIFIHVIFFLKIYLHPISFILSSKSTNLYLVGIHGIYFRFYGFKSFLKSISNIGCM
jgi:hypothetical protein